MRRGAGAADPRHVINLMPYQAVKDNQVGRRPLEIIRQPVEFWVMT